MTQQEYERRNLEGFEADTIMKERVKKLISDYNIDIVIEGGTYLGGTARQFAFMAREVITIEIDDKHFLRANKMLQKYSNVRVLHGDTVSVLPDVIKQIKQRDGKQNILFWCDSHWGEFNPLLAELQIFAESGLSPVIAIHDFKVPGHPELGFDTYGSIVYEWDWIKDSVDKIYNGVGYKTEYNSEANGAKRGVIYITPNLVITQ